MTSPYRFDPRKNSAVTLRFVEKVPTNSTMYRSQEIPVKTFVVGPHVKGRPYPLTIPSGVNEDPAPPFLEKDGTWSPDAPQYQFSNTLTMSPRATLTSDHDVQPVAAVHSYNDASPVAIHDVVQEGTLPRSTTSGMDFTGTKNSYGATQTTIRPVTAAAAPAPATVRIMEPSASQRARPARPASAGRAPNTPPPRPASPLMETTKPASPNTYRHSSTGRSQAWASASAEPGQLPSALAHTTVPYTAQPDMWSPYGAPLKIHDLQREESLAQAVVPGSSNCKLIGGRWRYIPAHSPGDPVYTDYYGRYADKANNYYGRSYHTTTNQFAKNKLVNDEAYIRVQASMPGINDLRYRPGLTLRTTLQNGATERLGSPNVHQISDFYRMRADKMRTSTKW